MPPETLDNSTREDTSHSPAPSASVTSNDLKTEVAEILKIKIHVEGPCKNPDGSYVAMAEGDMGIVKVSAGDVVEVFLDEVSQGPFMVGRVVEDPLEPGKCRANVVPVNSVIEAKRMESGEMPRTEYKVKNLKFRQDAPDKKPTICLPTAVCKLLGFQVQEPKEGEMPNPVLLKGQEFAVHFNGAEHTIYIQPIGTSVGLKGGAAKKLGLNDDIKLRPTTLGVRIEGGKLYLG